MLAIILLFISLSLGTFMRIPIGSSTYELQYVEIVLILLSINLIFDLISSKRKFEMNSFQYNMGIFFLLIFSYGIFLFIWSDYGITVLPGSLSFFYGILTVFVSSYYYQKDKEVYLLGFRILIIVMFIQLSISMLGLFGSGVSGFYAVKDFARTPMGKSNLISFYFVFGLLYEFIAREKRWIFYFLINLIALVLTLSRGAIFSLGFALFIYLIIVLINPKFNKKKVIKSFLFLIGVLVIFMLTTSVGDEFLQALSSGLGARTVGTRQVLWRNAFTETVENPLGVGIVWVEDPHNVIFSVWRNLGFVLGTVYLVFLAHPFLYFLHNKVRYYSPKTVGLLVAYASVFIHAFIEIYYFSSISVVFTVLTINYINLQLKEELMESSIIGIKDGFSFRKLNISGGKYE